MHAIDEHHPLSPPIASFNQFLIKPRLDRLDDKTAYFVEYIEYLERRIIALEAQVRPR